METSPLVSVIIPVWNGASLLPETLRSLQAQTYTRFEALILDDGSTDNTAAVAREFCEADPRLRFVPRLHSGVSATRNAGLEMAHGEFIAFLDSDDVWLPTKLERQMELFRSDPRTTFAYTNFYFWDGERDLSLYYRSNKPLPDGDSARQLVAACVYGMSTVVVRRAAFERTGGFDSELEGCEDWDMWLRLLEHGFWARGIREPLARYRRWPGSLSANKYIIFQNDLLVLEKNRRATRRAELRPLYDRAIRNARGRLELARAKQLLAASPGEVPSAIWRAWRHQPRRWKWLMWFVLAIWPNLLGGTAMKAIAHRKIMQKF